MTKLAIFIYSGTQQALNHALSLAMTGLSYGEETTIVLFNDGLAAWVDSFNRRAAGYGTGQHAQVLESGFRRMNVPSVPVMVRECQDVGGENLTILACSGSVEVLGYDSTELIEQGRVDDVVGLPTVWRRVTDARIITV